MRLHEFAPSKCRDIFSPKLEPLTVFPPFSEALMPVPLNSGGVVGLDRVDRDYALWKLDRHFVFPAPGCVTATNLVVLPGLE